MLIDGRNRREACRIAEVTPAYRIVEADPDKLKALVWSWNGPRRHLSSSQKAMAYAKDRVWFGVDFLSSPPPPPLPPSDTVNNSVDFQYSKSTDYFNGNDRGDGGDRGKGCSRQGSDFHRTAGDSGYSCYGGSGNPADDGLAPPPHGDSTTARPEATLDKQADEFLKSLMSSDAPMVEKLADLAGGGLTAARHSEPSEPSEGSFRKPPLETSSIGLSENKVQKVQKVQDLEKSNSTPLPPVDFTPPPAAPLPPTGDNLSSPHPVDFTPSRQDPLPPTASSDAGELWAILKLYRGAETADRLARKLGWNTARVMTAAMELRGYGLAGISGAFISPIHPPAAGAGDLDEGRI